MIIRCGCGSYLKIRYKHMGIIETFPCENCYKEKYEKKYRKGYRKRYEKEYKKEYKERQSLQ